MVGPGDLATGAVVIAETGGERIECAYGTRFDGRPVEPSDLTALYCSTKPLLAVAALKLVEAGRLHLDTTLAEVLSWLDGHWIGRLSLDQILSHDSNLHRMGLVLPLLVEPDLRAARLLELPEEPLEQTGRGYSDVSGWFLLGHVIEAVTGEDFRHHTRVTVLDRYGIDLRALNLGIPHDRFDAWRDDIAPNLYRVGDGALHPLATEACRIWACEWNPALSGYGTAAGLAAFYRGLLGDLAGAGVVLAAETLSAAVTPGPVYPDPRLLRDVAFGHGFMTDLSLFRLGGGPSHRSFGHMGMGGCSVGFADPEHDLVVVVVINAVYEETPELLERRVHVIDAIYEELGLGG